MPEPMFIVRAEVSMHFFPGTMIEAKGKCIRTVDSEPMTRVQAAEKLAEWSEAVKAPGWKFSILPVKGGAPCPTK